MNKSEVTRTINNIKKLKNAIITKHLSLISKNQDIAKESMRIQENIKDIIFYLDKISKEILRK